MHNAKDSNKAKKVLVALSGNIDSAVCAFLLKQQGCDVMGIYLVHDQSAAFLGLNESSIEKAKKIADLLNIKFFAAKVDDLFQSSVVDPYLDKRSHLVSASSKLDYHDMIFNVLLDKADKLGCDKIATGHFAKIQFDTSSGLNTIFSANDLKYDQSYFISSLSQADVDRLVLPLGEILKSDCDKIAKKFISINQDSGDEAVESVSESDFLSQRIPKFFFRNVEIKDIDKDESIGSFESLPEIEIGANVERYLPQIKKGKVILRKGIGDSVIAGDPENLSFKFLEITNLNLLDALKSQYILEVEAKIINIDSSVKGVLRLKSLGNATFVANEYLPLVLGRWNIVFYLRQGSTRKLIGRGVIGRCLESLDSKRLSQVALENELEQSPNNNFRF